MNTNRDNSFLFTNENTIFRIVSIAKILSWVILVFYLIIFANSLSGIFQGPMNWPTEFSQLILTLLDLFFPLVIGLFYFLVLQGVAHGLNLGLDIYYDFQPEEDEEDEE